jgi:hypothetical protein
MRSRSGASISAALGENVPFLASGLPWQLARCAVFIRVRVQRRDDLWLEYYEPPLLPRPYSVKLLENKVFCY